MSLGSVDREGIAFRAGLRDGIRTSVEAERVDDVRRRLERIGVVRQSATELTIGGGRVVWILYVGRDEATAEEIAEAEAPLFTRPRSLSPAEIAERHGRIGRVLGYPACCVAAFTRWTQRGVGRLSEQGPVVADETYTSVHEAWVPRPSPYANPLLMPYGVNWISFFPCTYDCANAVELGRRIHDAALREVGAEVHAHHRLLERDIVVGRWGQRALVEFDDRSTIVGAAAPEGVNGRIDERDAEFVRQLFGRRVQADGRLRGDERPAPIGVRFGGRSG